MDAVLCRACECRTWSLKDVKCNSSCVCDVTRLCSSTCSGRINGEWRRAGMPEGQFGSYCNSLDERHGLSLGLWQT